MLGKLFGGGLLLVVVIGLVVVMDVVDLGGFGGIFGGNLVLCVVAVVVFDMVVMLEFYDCVIGFGEKFVDVFDGIAVWVESVGETRGFGLMWVLELVCDWFLKVLVLEFVQVVIGAVWVCGLLLFGCGLYLNVIWLFFLFMIFDDDFVIGLEWLEVLFM